MKASTVEKEAKTLHVPHNRGKGLKVDFIKFCLLLVEGHNGFSDVCRSYPFHGPPLGLPTLKQSGKYGIQRTEGGRGCTFRVTAGVPRPPSVFLQPRIKFAAGAWKREEKAEGRRRRTRPRPPPRGHLAIPDMETAEGRKAEVRRN